MTKIQKRKALINVLVAGILIVPFLPLSASAQTQSIIILCYHDVPEKVSLDDYGVDQRSFINTVEYFRRHDFTFISLDDLLQAHHGQKPLPAKAVMLTFDDGYRTFYDFVYPLLREYKIPSLLAIVTGWIDGQKPDSVKHDLMTWEQIKEVAGSEYVEVISHTHDLHKGITFNPQGNEAPAAVNRVYAHPDNAYEPDESYQQRIQQDLKMSKQLLEEKTGQKIRAIAWPYGQYNRLTASQAKELGLEVSFALGDPRANIKDFNNVERYLVSKNPALKDLLKGLKLIPVTAEQKRIVQVDIDLIYDDDPQITEKNLGLLLERIKALAPTTVYLQAFADPSGEGNVSMVYFPNTVLPVRADLFSRVVHQLRTRANVEVYAWMPMLSIVLPDEEKNARLRVREKRDGVIAPSTSWYHRLSPFSREAAELLQALYEDMARHAFIDGVVFQDDGYLNDYEDFHPEAVEAYKNATDIDLSLLDESSYKNFKSWARFKTSRLNAFADQLKSAVLKHRPQAKFARTLYAPVVIDPQSEQWLSQNYEDSLAIYDYVVIMAYPYMEEARRPVPWLKDLVGKVKTYEGAIEKTVFKVQSYDWFEDRWVEAEELDRWLRALIAQGARHIGYYPDDAFADKPESAVIHRMMSIEDFPFKRAWK